MDELAIAIQAGGASTRMGQDKGLLQFGSKTLVEFILDQVSDLADEILVVSNEPYLYSFLGYPVYRDVTAGIGALGGIFSVLTYLRSKRVLILACDMPFVSRPLLEHMLNLEIEYDVIIPQTSENGHLEPFRAVYRKECIGPVRTAIEAGKRRAIAFHPQVQVREIKPEEIERFDPEGLSFVNINTEEELREAKKIINRK